MRKIIRTSETAPRTRDSYAYRIVLVKLGQGYVVWMQVLPDERDQRPFFSQGDYYDADEVEEAGQRFLQRARSHGLAEVPVLEEVPR